MWLFTKHFLNSFSLKHCVVLLCIVEQLCLESSKDPFKDRPLKFTLVMHCRISSTNYNDKCGREKWEKKLANVDACNIKLNIQKAIEHAFNAWRLSMLHTEKASEKCLHCCFVVFLFLFWTIQISAWTVFEIFHRTPCT